MNEDSSNLYGNVIWVDEEKVSAKNKNKIKRKIESFSVSQFYFILFFVSQEKLVNERQSF